MTSSREQILKQIDAGTRGVATPIASLREAYNRLPRTYDRAGSLQPDCRIALMVERLQEYGATVLETTPEHLPTAIRTQLAATGKHRFVVPVGLPAAWMPNEYQWRIDHGMAIEAIEECEGVLTAASAGIADSGTIVLHHGPTEGRRVITLLPDTHLCVLYTSQIVETLPEYFDRCTAPPPLVTWISGPSATADIEMTRIKGVHGPRFLFVILVSDSA